MGRWLVLGICIAGCSGASEQDVLAPSSAGAVTTPTGTSTTPAPTTTSTAPDPKFSNCAQEKEPNDSPDKANSLNGSALCGQISTPSDADFVTFKLKSSTRHLNIAFDGKISLKITVGNQTVTLVAGDGQAAPFDRNNPYIVQVLPTEKGGTPQWRVEVTETP